VAKHIISENKCLQTAKDASLYFQCILGIIRHTSGIRPRFIYSDSIHMPLVCLDNTVTISGSSGMILRVVRVIDYEEGDYGEDREGGVWLRFCSIFIDEPYHQIILEQLSMEM